MIILDENILETQRLLLEAWGLTARQIGVDVGRKGIKDDEVLVLLLRQRSATFFSRDSDFYRPDLRHRRYCLAVANVGQSEVAAFVRRFMRHREFDTQAKRMGCIVRISHSGLAAWCWQAQAEISVAWNL